MSVQKLPSGRWRAQVYDPATGKNVSVSKVLGGAGTFRTKTEAKDARTDARRRLRGRGVYVITVAEFRERWLTDPLFEPPKESTRIHNAERTKAFAAKYGDVSIEMLGTDLGDVIVAEWLAGGARNGSVPALRAMLNQAMSAKGGRLLARNPFAGLGIERTKGNRETQPPAQAAIENMVALAHELTPPSFAAYLEFAGVTAARPSELDALRPEWVDYEAAEVHLKEQWNAKSRTFTPPKYGPYTIALVGRARDVLMALKREAGHEDFVFTTIRGTHYTPSSRTHHWNRVRAAAGLGNTTLYLATRHYFGWYAINVLELDSAVVAEQFGHKDGGKLVEQLYGHPDKARRRRKIREAYDGHATVRPLRVVREDTA